MSGFIFGGPLGPYFELFLIFTTNTTKPFFFHFPIVTKHIIIPHIVNIFNILIADLSIMGY